MPFLSPLRLHPFLPLELSTNLWHNLCCLSVFLVVVNDFAAVSLGTMSSYLSPPRNIQWVFWISYHRNCDACISGGNCNVDAHAIVEIGMSAAVRANLAGRPTNTISPLCSSKERDESTLIPTTLTRTRGELLYVIMQKYVNTSLQKRIFKRNQHGWERWEWCESTLTRRVPLPSLPRAVPSPMFNTTTSIVAWPV